MAATGDNPRFGSDEETPLILREGGERPTPLPWFQFCIVIILQLAEPLSLHVIFPFSPQLIRDTKVSQGKESQVGYYVGILQSSFFLAEALTILMWSRASDRVGRKPVILSGLLGLSLSMYRLGLSTTFRGLVLSRILNGVLNGNSGVVKSIIAEMTDSTNISVAYAYLPITWCVGSTVGPIIGGSLSNPTVEFPMLFGKNDFLKKYPYFLPCAVPATFTLLAWIIAFIFLKETHPKPMTISHFLGLNKIRACHTKINSRVADIELPPPLRSVFTCEVLVSAGNYASVSLVEICFRAIYPVFLATPIDLGGLGLSPLVIGKLLSILGILIGISQLCFFAKINNRWGPKRVFIGGLAFFFPVFILFPVISTLARHQGHSFTVFAAVGLQIVFFVSSNFSFSAIFILITTSAPNHASLGATMGFSQTTVSFMRALGPAIANSLYSLSIEKSYLGGYLVYYILLIIVVFSLMFGRMLPRHVKNNRL